VFEVRLRQNHRQVGSARVHHLASTCCEIASVYTWMTHQFAVSLYTVFRLDSIWITQTFIWHRRDDPFFQRRQYVHVTTRPFTFIPKTHPQCGSYNYKKIEGRASVYSGQNEKRYEIADIAKLNVTPQTIPAYFLGTLSLFVFN